MTNTLATIEQNEGAMQLQTGQQTDFFRVLDTGLIIHAGTPHEEWRENIMRPALEDFERTRNNHSASMFRLGDALAFGEREYGELYANEIDATRKFVLLNAKTIDNAMRIAKNVRPENRHEMLTFSHHDVVQGLEPEEQKELLDKAEDEAWTVAQLRKEVKTRHPKEPTDPANPGTGKKAVIDVESEDGLLHAAEKIAEFFQSESTTPDQWSKERTRQWSPVIASLVTYFGAMEPVARAASDAVAAFLAGENVKNWSDKRKAAWSPSVNAIAKAGRRGELTSCGVSKKAKSEEPTTEEVPA